MAQPSRGLRQVFSPWRGVIWQLFLFTILPLAVLTVVIAFGSLTVHQHAMRALVGERDERAVRTAAAALEEQLKHRQDAIRGLSILSDRASSDQLQGILDSSNYLLDDFDTGLAFFSPDGSLASITGDRLVWEGLVDQVRPMILDFLKQNNTDVLITSNYYNPANQEKWCS